MQSRVIIIVYFATALFIVLILCREDMLWRLPHSAESQKPNFEIDEKIIETYQMQSKQRHNALMEKIEDQGYGILYNVLVPEVFCKNLARIGNIGDGGKWICNPTAGLQSQNCTIYSLGISNDPSFEEDLQKFLNKKCKLRCADKDEQTPETMERIENANGIFKKALIGPTTNATSNSFQLSSLLSEFGDSRIDIFKVDIERAEFDILSEIISVPICQILIEIHGKTPKQTLEMLQTLSKNEFYLFSYEINGFFHELSEYSFIHKDCLLDFDVKTIYGKYLS